MYLIQDIYQSSQKFNFSDIEAGQFRMLCAMHNRCVKEIKEIREKLGEGIFMISFLGDYAESLAKFEVQYSYLERFVSRFFTEGEIKTGIDGKVTFYKHLERLRKDSYNFIVRGEFDHNSSSEGKAFYDRCAGLAHAELLKVVDDIYETIERNENN